MAALSAVLTVMKAEGVQGRTGLVAISDATSIFSRYLLSISMLAKWLNVEKTTQAIRFTHCCLLVFSSQVP